MSWLITMSSWSFLLYKWSRCYTYCYRVSSSWSVERWSMSTSYIVCGCCVHFSLVIIWVRTWTYYNRFYIQVKSLEWLLMYGVQITWPLWVSACSHGNDMYASGWPILLHIEFDITDWHFFIEWIKRTGFSSWK